jgi:hypothetical protein
MLLGIVLALLANGCRSERKAGVEELFSLRSQGLTFLHQDDLPAAEAQFRKLVELAPDEPLGHADLGLTLLRAGRFDEAEEHLLRARKLDPASADIGLMLAKLYSLTRRPDEAREILEGLRRDAPGNPHVLYALAELEAGADSRDALGRYEARLREVLAAAPGNLAVRLMLVEALARGGQADSVVRHLEEIRRIPPAPPAEAGRMLERTLELLRTGTIAAAKPTLDRFVQEMELTTPYQAALDAVNWTEGPLVGRPVLTFVPEDYLTLRALGENDSTKAVRFTDVTGDVFPGSSAPSALPTSPSSARPAATVLATGDVDGDGIVDLFVSFPSADGRTPVLHLYRFRGGQVLDVTERSGISLPADAVHATLADYDNDGWLDLFVLGGEGRGHLFRNRGDLTFEEVTAQTGIGDVTGARRALFADLDHDGDLDLLLVGERPRAVYRNNLDGTFTDVTASYGLAGGAAARDAHFGDFDGDGRIDLFFANGTGKDQLFHNGGAQRFRDVTAGSGLASAGASGAAAVGDFNNDGFLDIFVGGARGVEPTLWLNQGWGTFSRSTRSDAAMRGLRSTGSAAAELLDYDNDGWLDLLVAGGSAAGGGRGLSLLHNEGDGSFRDRSDLLPPDVGPASTVAVADVDEDGDQDLLVGDARGTLRLLRNDGGNLRLAVQVTLKALRTGSGKNNVFGIGARVELRAGELRETRVVTGQTTHFGLGPHLKADVLRVEWPNGVPQTVYFPGTDQDVVEVERLKGSCAFVYAWDGERFRFVTDVMWRSALGMPLGLMGSGTAFADAGASREYLRIPGSALRPRDGKYVLQLTEELWETAYVDKIRLLAVDHPDSVDVFVDERFVPPGPVELRLFRAARPRPPLSATNEAGDDLLPALRAKDDVYVSRLTPSRYQGIVEPHDLVMDLGADAGAPGTFLFLRGWIYPTDASINVALGQQSELTPAAPSLEVSDGHGGWTMVESFLSFPSGKDKTMVIDLAGRFPTRDHRVRIRTNMQIYWDQAFVAHDEAGSPARVTELAPASADLHYRGFSRTYRKGGRYGPDWFAYDEVSRESPWRPITGAFTRYGDVAPLLHEPDDMYVVMAAGDETTVQFDAGSAPALPPGWRRDFLLYSDGWIKDSDLNTAFGTTVGPLPFHAIEQYPYAPGESYPKDAAHQRYLRDYNTRVVKGR